VFVSEQMEHFAKVSENRGTRSVRQKNQSVSRVTNTST
jgi:hypothetical protein